VEGKYAVMSEERDGQRRRPGPSRGVLVGVLFVGFMLGTTKAGAGSPWAMGLLWAVATAVGSLVGGLILSWLLMEVVMDYSEAEKISEETGLKLMLFFMALSAAIIWGWLWLSVP